MSTRVSDPDSYGSSVVGYCPACGWSGLFVGSGGYVTCSQFDCPDPGAPSDVLATRRPRRRGGPPPG